MIKKILSLKKSRLHPSTRPCFARKGYAGLHRGKRGGVDYPGPLKGKRIFYKYHPLPRSPRWSERSERVEGCERWIYFLSIATALIFFPCAYPLIVGSNTTPSRQTYTTFPIAGTDNTMLGFAVFENGFALQSHLATCTYDSFFPVNNRVDLRGGRLFLARNLLFGLSTNITSSGSLWGNGLEVEFSPQSIETSLSTSLFFDRTSIFLNNSTRLNAPIQFRGNCAINGKGKLLRLSGASELIVRPGASLLLEDVTITGIRSSKIRCLTDSGSVVLRNAMLAVDANFTFSRGSLLFDEDTIITGSTKFNYTTGLSSTIARGALLFVDSGMTLSYAPRRPRSNLIYMEDNSSSLFLNGCTLHSTRTGLTLSRGSLILDNRVTFSSEARNSGEALTLDRTLTVSVLGNAWVDVYGLIKMT